MLRNTLFVQVFITFFAIIGQSIIIAEVVRIAFGSCYDQNVPSDEIWRTIANKKINLMLLTGDNVYIDSTKPKKFANGYASLSNNKGFQYLKTKSDIMATWDDHDYGLQDGGKNFSAKVLAKKYFVAFFNYDELLDIPKADGVQHSRIIKVGNKKIRIIMLDTRWYRDELLLNNLQQETRTKFQLGPYRPHLDKSKTLLGERQWQWLESTLAKPVDMNIIVSSIQFLAEYTAWETWANFPHERNRMIGLLERYSKNKVVIISGDVHRAETSMMSINDWALYDITSSGLTSSMYPGKPNIHRLGESQIIHNFGMLRLEDSVSGLTIKSTIYDVMGNELSSHIIPIK